MSSGNQPVDPCPARFDPERVAALVSDGSDEQAWAHVYACAACAEVYFEHVVVRDVAREIHGERDVERAPARRSGVLRRLQWLPIAALVLVAVGGIATATMLLRRRPVVVHTDGWRGGSLGELQLRTGLKTGELELPLDARVLALTSTVEGEGRLGTTAILQSVGGAQHELLGFTPDGELRWVGSRDWPDWDQTLGMHSVGFHNMPGVVLRRVGARMQEAVCVVAERGRTGGLFLVAPETGRKLGHYLHPGRLAVHVRGGETVCVLPATDGEVRRLLVPGQHGHDGERHPCVSVLEVDPEGGGGLRLVQHVELPAIGAIGPEGAAADLCLVDWTPGHERVVIETNEYMLFAADLVDGRLAVDGMVVGYSDATRSRYDAHHGKGAFAAWEAKRLEGAAEGVTVPDLLAGEIEETEFEEVATWLVR